MGALHDILKRRPPAGPAGPLVSSFAARHDRPVPQPGSQVPVFRALMKPRQRRYFS